MSDQIIIIHKGHPKMVNILEKHATYYLVGVNDGSMNMFRVSIDHIKALNQTTNSRGPIINLLDKI